MKAKRYMLTAVLGAMMIVFGITTSILKTTYAAETETSHAIFFFPSGGTFVGNDAGKEYVNFTVVAGTVLKDHFLKPENPVRSDATFKYWSLSGSQEEYDFNTPVTSEISLCARWVCDGCTIPEDPTPPKPPKVDPTPNPSTADLPIAIIMSIGLCAFGLSIFQYKLLKSQI